MPETALQLAQDYCDSGGPCAEFYEAKLKAIDARMARMEEALERIAEHAVDGWLPARDGEAVVHGYSYVSAAKLARRALADEPQKVLRSIRLAAEEEKG